jgi:hypothetical protein
LASSKLDGANITWGAQARGGGNQPVAILMQFREPAELVGGGELEIQANGSGSGYVRLSVKSDGSIAVLRRGVLSSGASVATAAGVLGHPGDRWLWADLPTAILTGTNPTLYYDGTGAWSAQSPTGATNVGGEADDLNTSVAATIYATGEEPLPLPAWGIGRLFVFQGEARPPDAAAARNVALAANPVAAALAYTGCCFAWAANNTTEDKFSEAGVEQEPNGTFEVVATGVRSARRRRMLWGVR